MSLYNQSEKILFEQETTQRYVGGVLDRIVQKVTVKNPAMLNGTSYTCTIFGDGT